jgi:transposase
MTNDQTLWTNTDQSRYFLVPEDQELIVKDFLETSKIKIIFLPPYSPNLNLIERLWKLMKKRVLYNKYYEKFVLFKHVIDSFFRKSSKLKNDLE